MLRRRRSTFSQNSQSELKPCFPAALEFGASGVDGFDRVVAYVLDGSEAEADGSVDWGEVGVGDLDVGRDNWDVHLAALGDVLDDLVGLARFRW